MVFTRTEFAVNVVVSLRFFQCLICECAGVNVFLSLKLQTDFDGRLNARQVELLVQYLTVPYLRIPLVAKLLCDESRVRALASVDLQSVFDSVIFEPGPWLSPPKVCTIFAP